MANHLIDIIHPNHIAQIWPIVLPMLAPCMKRSTGEMTIEQMQVRAVDGTWPLMVYVDDGKIVGALIFEFINYPNDRVMFINAIGGKTTQEHVEAMYQWAKASGATSVRGAAQEAVARLWKKQYGFNKIAHIVEKRL